MPEEESKEAIGCKQCNAMVRGWLVSGRYGKGNQVQLEARIRKRECPKSIRTQKKSNHNLKRRHEGIGLPHKTLSICDEICSITPTLVCSHQGYMRHHKSNLT